MSNKNTADYKRGYSRGCQSGKKELSNLMESHRKRLSCALDRAVRAEKNIGRGTCSECLNWSRVNECAWGYCIPPKSMAVKNSPIWFDPGHERLVTSESFGCNMFIPTNEPPK